MIKCGYCKGLHGTVADVRRCAEAEDFVPPSLRSESWVHEDDIAMQDMEYAADRAESARDSAAKVAKWDAEMSLSEMIAAVQDLLTGRALPKSEWRWVKAIKELITGRSGRVTEYALRTAIAKLETYPERAVAAPKPQPKPVTAAGLYRYEGGLYQVIFNKEKTRLYAKRVTLPAEGVKARPRLDYAPGIVIRLTPSDLVPMEEANEITRQTGWCVFGHFLTNPKSIARGMGPKCWAKYGAETATEAAA